jgi:(E)-4-hydroxy-3-methylbut-2-enyl-diphosphate synthase
VRVNPGNIKKFDDKVREIAAAARDHGPPIRIGVTEAGPLEQGPITSAVAFGVLLAEGIGDTIRVSLSAPPVHEVKVGIGILESLGLRERGLEIVSCRSCGPST